MDTATMDLLRQNIAGWCTRNAAFLEAIEHGWPTDSSARRFAELDGLGVLHIAHEETMRDRADLVAEVVYAFALRSPSLALLVLQQNMAARLLAEAGAPAPTGWVALPMYDSPAEWPHQLAAGSDTQTLLKGVWRSLPALPLAESVLVPIIPTEAAPFLLAKLDCRSLPPGVTVPEAAKTLGLRGCPVGDLQFREAVLPPASILASGDEMRKTMTLVWSHAEAVVLAIRAAILRRSYETAREYAAERWQGGKIIIEHSLVRQMLADIHLASCQIDDAWKGMVTAIEPGKPLRTGQLAVSLRFAAELPKLTSDGIQLLGGNGYMEDFGQERLFRDAKQCEMLLGHPQAKRFSAWEQV